MLGGDTNLDNIIRKEPDTVVLPFDVTDTIANWRIALENNGWTRVGSTRGPNPLFRSGNVYNIAIRPDDNSIWEVYTKDPTVSTNGGKRNKSKRKSKKSKRKIRKSIKTKGRK